MTAEARSRTEVSACAIIYLMSEFYSDGSAVPNPGDGGFAVIKDGQPVALGGEPDTTNIRMEAKALMAALQLAKDGDTIFTDSEFWLNVLKKWAPVWEQNHWTKKSSGPIQNLDLVQELYAIFKTRPHVQLVWTRGHVGTEGNESADEWANRARQGARL